MRALITALLIAVPLTAGADTGAGHGKFTKHKSGTFFMVTAEKHFSIELELEGGDLKEGMNSGELVQYRPIQLNWLLGLRLRRERRTYGPQIVAPDREL